MPRPRSKPSPFLDRLRESLRETCGVEAGRVAVAASGGVDSMVLLRSLHALGVDVVALHVDHGLRADARLDGDVVEATAEALDISCERLRVEVGEGNTQAEARRARYHALAVAARRAGCRALATGHTATDQAETVLMHLVRGAGLRGLAGMAPRRDLTLGVTLVRPLLWATRADVEAEASRHGWAWRDDASNDADAYTRNRIRHHVLPLLDAEGGPDTARRIAASAAAARAALPDLDAFTVGPCALGLDRLRDARDRGAVWVEALAAWAPDATRSADLVAQLDALLDKSVGRHVPVGHLTAWRDRDAVRFVEAAKPVEVRVEVGHTAQTPLGRLEIVALDERTISSDPSREADGDRVLLDVSALDATLTLRTWRAGDRIAPHGLEGTQLVSDVLTDRRVRSSERDRQLVLCVGDRVAWVVGHRLAAWAALSDTTEVPVLVSWEPVVSAPSRRRRP